MCVVVVQRRNYYAYTHTVVPCCMQPMTTSVCVGVWEWPASTPLVHGRAFRPPCWHTHVRCALKCAFSTHNCIKLHDRRRHRRHDTRNPNDRAASYMWICSRPTERALPHLKPGQMHVRTHTRTRKTAAAAEHRLRARVQARGYLLCVAHGGWTQWIIFGA